MADGSTEPQGDEPAEPTEPQGNGPVDWQAKHEEAFPAHAGMIPPGAPRGA